MRDENIHPSDQDLLLVADGEVSQRRAAEVRGHLEACWQCRARMAEIETTIVDFVRAYHQTDEHKFSSSARPRALLKARLTELAESSKGERWQWLRLALIWRRLAYVCAMILLALFATRALYQRTVRIESGAKVYAGVLPDPKITPGATRPVAISDVCSTPHDEVVRYVPNALQWQVLTEYGIPKALGNDYEVDFLISPGLGGADDLRNLWPQPRRDTTWNSYVKDQLEEHLHSLVCSGKIDLSTAQRQIASNWIVAYEKYFGADHPTPDHIGSGAFTPAGNQHDRWPLSVVRESHAAAPALRPPTETGDTSFAQSVIARLDLTSALDRREFPCSG
jgi:hypothetical protein